MSWKGHICDLSYGIRNATPLGMSLNSPCPEGYTVGCFVPRRESDLLSISCVSLVNVPERVSS